MALYAITVLAALIPGLGLLILRKWGWGTLVVAITAMTLASYATASFSTDDSLQNGRLVLIGLIWVIQYAYTIKLARPYGSEVLEEEPSDDSRLIENDELSWKGEYLIGGEIPPEYYLPESAILRGWPGHRNRPHRLGLDPLENDFERAHMIGLFIRKVITGSLITEEPFYLFLMFVTGIFSLSPLIFVLILALFESPGYLLLILFFSPLIILGVGLFVSFYRSRLMFRLKMVDAEE